MDAGQGLGDCARQRLLELEELRPLDVVLPVRGSEGTPTEVRRRVVARPEPARAMLLARLGLEVPRTPKIVANVVPKNAPSKTQPTANQAMPLHN